MVPISGVQCSPVRGHLPGALSALLLPAPGIHEGGGLLHFSPHIKYFIPYFRLCCLLVALLTHNRQLLCWILKLLRGASRK